MADADPSSTNGVREDALRLAFIEMLFALAVSEVAIHAAEIAQIDQPLGELLPSITHLSLGLLLIATSWVGWRQSNSPGMGERVKSVISWSFVGLLLDVLIVVVYFVLIKQVEVKTKGDEPTLQPASARPEAIWLCAVFGVYAVWDLVTDMFPPGCLEAKPWPRRLWIGVRVLCLSPLASVISLGLSYYVYLLAQPGQSDASIVVLDIALICVVLLFRLFKLAENFLAPCFRIDHLKAFKNPREWGTRHVVAFVVLVLIYIAATLIF